MRLCFLTKFLLGPKKEKRLRGMIKEVADLYWGHESLKDCGHAERVIGRLFNKYPREFYIYYDRRILGKTYKEIAKIRNYSPETISIKSRRFEKRIDTTLRTEK